jgi:hypothetical protein
MSKKPKLTPKANYEVGYGKPPISTRFQKDQPSPNPNGRPPKEVSVLKALEECLDEDLVVSGQDGKKTKMKANKVIAKRIVNQAVSGSVETQKMIVRLEHRPCSKPTKPEEDPEKAANDLALQQSIMETYLVAIGNQASARRSGLFELDENGRLIASGIGKPIATLFSDLDNSKIRSAGEYRVRLQECISLFAEAMKDHAFERIQIWNRSLQKSDLD